MWCKELALDPSEWGTRVYDNHGSLIACSSQKPAWQEEEQWLRETLRIGQIDPRGPYTAVVWPKTVVIAPLQILTLDGVPNDT